MRQILISKSQLQPVMNAAAAGGKMMATCAHERCHDSASRPQPRAPAVFAHGKAAPRKKQNGH